MISEADVRKLRAISASEPTILSVYVWVPVDLDELRGLPARADDLIKLTVGTPGRRAIRETIKGKDGRQALTEFEAERRFVRERLELHGRDWMGHTVAIFAGDEAGMREEFALPCVLKDRAVVADRPHVRPLLVALQRCPEYLTAVVDRQHAWIFQVSGTQIESVAQQETPGVRSHGFAGWYGLESYRINERITDLAKHHFRETGAILTRALRGHGRPLVVGGHEETIPRFLAALPGEVRDRFAGSFVIDPHTMTPARVRELSEPVLRDWATERERRLVAELSERPPDGLTVTGLKACMEAVGQHAIRLLVLPVGGLMPGFRCQRCGALGTTAETCAHGPSQARPVPDLLEEIAAATIEGGGEVASADEVPGDVMARLRYRLPEPVS